MNAEIQMKSPRFSWGSMQQGKAYISQRKAEEYTVW